TDCSNLLFSVTYNRGINVSGRCDESRSTVSRFLKQVSGVSARPFPLNFVRRRCAILPFPPRQIRLPSKTSVHCLNHISRISEQTDLARLPQRFESNCRCGDLGLLVGRGAEIFSNSAPESFVSQQSHRRGAACNLPIPEARAVAENRYTLERRILFLFVCHS